MKAGFLLMGMMLLIAGCNDGGADALVVSGRVERDQVHVGSKVGGRVEAVHFEEGETVREGDVLIELEQQEIEAERAEAQARVGQARAALDLLLAGTREEDIRRGEAEVAARRAELLLRERGFRQEEILQAEAELLSARSSADYARSELTRAEELGRSGSLQDEEVDRSRRNKEVSEASVAIAEQRLALMRSGSRPEEIEMARAALAAAEAELDRLRKGARVEEIAAARAALEAAEAAVALVEAQAREMKITVPNNALVDTLDLEPGDLVKAGQPLAVLTLEKAPWVRCYVPENRLGELKAGTAVEVTVDSWPGRVFAGRVRRLSSEAEFTPRNVQTAEKRAELVFEATVDITDGGEDLRAGMYADVRIAGPGAK